MKFQTNQETVEVTSSCCDLAEHVKKSQEELWPIRIVQNSPIMRGIN